MTDEERARKVALELIGESGSRKEQILVDAFRAIRDDCAKVVESYLNGRCDHPAPETRAERKHDNLVREIAQAIRTHGTTGEGGTHGS